LIYRKLTGLSIDDKAEKIQSENETMVKSESISSITTKDDESEEDDQDEERDSEEEEEENEDDDVFKKQSRGKRNEDKESKKVRICLLNLNKIPY
jgi:hypothetical protein